MPTKISTRGVFDNSYSPYSGGPKPKAVTLTRSRTGEILPKYKDEISKLRSATTLLSAYEQTCSITKSGALSVQLAQGHPLGQISFTDTWMGMAHNFNGHQFSIATSLADTFVKQDAVNRALAQARTIASSKVRSIQQPFNTQVFVAELREVRQLFRGPLLSYLAKLQASPLSSVSKVKGARNSPKDRLSSKDIANEWLGLQFGLVPLIRDISDIAKLFNEKAMSSATTRIHAYGRGDSILLDDLTFGTIPGIKLNVRLIRQGYAECFITSGIAKQYQEKLSGISALSNQALDILNLPVTAWELLPWSFLMDYFVNVGDIINATTTASSLVSYVSETVVKTVEYHGQSSYQGIDRPDLIQSVKVLEPVKEYNAKLRVVNRVGGSLGIPPLTITLPGSNIRFANMAALLLSNLHK